MREIPQQGQTPGQPAAPPNANIVVENPTRTAIPLELEVSRPAAEVFTRAVGNMKILAEGGRLAPASL